MALIPQCGAGARLDSIHSVPHLAIHPVCDVATGSEATTHFTRKLQILTKEQSFQDQGRQFRIPVHGVKSTNFFVDEACFLRFQAFPFCLQLRRTFFDTIGKPGIVAVHLGAQHVKFGAQAAAKRGAMYFCINFESMKIKNIP